MELQDYVRILRRRWRIVVAGLLAALAVAAAQLYVNDPVYEARTDFFVSTATSPDTSTLLQDSSFTQQQVDTYAAVLTSPLVLAPVVEQLDLPGNADSLAGRIITVVPERTVLIVARIRYEDPETAKRIADAVGAQFPAAVAELERVAPDQPSPVKITTVREATVPTSPVEPQPTRELAVSTLVGLIIGCGLALLRHQLDTSLRTVEDVAAVTDRAVIGTIPYDRGLPARLTLHAAAGSAARIEAIKTVRTNLRFLDAPRRARVLTFTSAGAGEGKTTIVADLALAMAATGAHVCVADGDLRRPRLSEYLGTEHPEGLTSVLIDQATLDEALRPYGGTTLVVLGSGPVPPNPSELLGSTRMEEVVAELRSRFDHVLIDAPAALPVTDAAVLGAIADGTVVVVGSGVVRRKQLRIALARLETVGANILGVVVNRLPATEHTYADSSSEQTLGRLPSRTVTRRRRRAGAGTNA